MTKSILYFTAGAVPTVAERAEIDALNALSAPGYHVGVRSALQSGLYLAGIEESDFVAGTVPLPFAAVPAYGIPDAARPVALSILPATVSIAALATRQLTVIAVTGDDVSELEVVDVTATNTTYLSSDPTKATVNASGLVSGVAAGTTTITATHTYATGKTIAATRLITVTA